MPQALDTRAVQGCTAYAWWSDSPACMCPPRLAFGATRIRCRSRPAVSELVSAHISLHPAPHLFLIHADTLVIQHASCNPCPRCMWPRLGASRLCALCEALSSTAGGDAHHRIKARSLGSTLTLCRQPQGRGFATSFTRWVHINLQTERPTGRGSVAVHVSMSSQSTGQECTLKHRVHRP
jgi:hypothetical protein